MKNCNHKKVYSNRVLMSNPPQISWTCEKCGETGSEKYNVSEQKIKIN